MSAATKEIMSSTRKGELNPLYGKSHSEASKELMRQKLGRKYQARQGKARQGKARQGCIPRGYPRRYGWYEETKLLMSSKRGNPVNIYEKCTS